MFEMVQEFFEEVYFAFSYLKILNFEFIDKHVKLEHVNFFRYYLLFAEVNFIFSSHTHSQFQVLHKFIRNAARSCENISGFSYNSN